MFGSSSTHHGATLLASVGAANISLGIVEHGTSGSSVRAQLSGALSAQERDNQQTATGLKKLLEEKVPALLKEYASMSRHKPVRNAYVVVHAPIADSRIVSDTRTFETEERITDAILDDCARSALGDLPRRPNFLGARLLQVRLNGYATARPEGKHVREVEVIGLAFSIEPTFKEPVLSTLQAALPGIATQFRSGLLAIAAASTAQAGEYAVFLLSGEGTEIVVMRRGIPSNYAFVPIGLRSIAERAGKGAPAETILSTMRIVGSGKGSNAAREEAEAALGAVEPEVAKIFGESFATLSSPLRLPVRAFVVSPPEMSDWFGRFLTRIDFAPFTLTAQPFEVQSITLPDLGQAQKEKDPDLTLAALLLKSEQLG